MKKILLYILIAGSFIKTESIFGQQGRNSPGVRAILLERQLDEVKKKISLNEKDVPEFERIYKNYIKEISAINNQERIPALSEINLTNLSDNEIEIIFFKQSERAKSLLIIREKYFKEFRKVIKPRDIVTIYRIEREVVTRAQQEMRRRMQLNRR